MQVARRSCRGRTGSFTSPDRGAERPDFGARGRYFYFLARVCAGWRVTEAPFAPLAPCYNLFAHGEDWGNGMMRKDNFTTALCLAFRLAPSAGFAYAVHGVGSASYA
jgi:hypothetical protein